MELESRITTSRILITGGCGFIGSNLLDFMLNQGYRNFRILDNLSVGSIEALESVLMEQGSQLDKRTGNGAVNYHFRAGRTSPEYASVELRIGDVRHKVVCEQSTRNVAAVVHLAAQSGVPTSIENPAFDCEVNVLGTLNLLEACRANGVKSFVFASSGAPLGEVKPPIHERKLPRPVSPYGASKLAGEAYCLAYYKSFGVKTVILRFGNVYGPRSNHKSSVVAKFFKLAVEGCPLEIYGDGSQTRDFIYVEDLCNAVHLSLKAVGLGGGNGSGVDQVAGEIFQIATFKETTVAEIAGRIKAIIAKETGRNLAIVHTEKRLGDVLHNYSDITKATTRLGFIPNYDLAKGLFSTWKTFRHSLPQ